MPARRTTFALKTSMLLLFVSLLPSHAATVSAMAGPNMIGQPGTVSYSMGGVYATASVGYGSAYAVANANCGSPGPCDVLALASFSDAITIFGMNGILRANVFLANNIVDGGATSTFSFGSLSGSLSNFSYFGPTCCSFQQSFTGGVGSAFSGSVHALADDKEPLNPNYGSEYGSGLVSFSFSVLDSSGQPISGFQYTSASWHDYGIVGGEFVTPEPMTMVLALGGFLVLMLLRGRRQKAKCSSSCN